MRYPIEHYDKNGFLNAPVWLKLGWLFLAKAWVVFVMAGASRDTGARILELIYPVHSTLYMGLITGAPAIVLFWLLGLRHQDRKMVVKLFSYGKSVTLLTIIVQLFLLVYQIQLDKGVFSWPNAISLVGLLWLLLFVLRSKRVKDCFRAPILE
ncbi:DUF2919 domain-containing protein [Vibrio hannami]|uniref:DUF2919 domain-containing protein n=1 Tax=Vibrio hannami TaxID=2717094 RepID=UPI00240F9952|nr:DUF2919 domain-containing protein [Vibrio hannami]MDG3087439.1 DUF2919 domain-containing protein [Vibrio hannami]